MIDTLVLADGERFGELVAVDERKLTRAYARARVASFVVVPAFMAAFVWSWSGGYPWLFGLLVAAFLAVWRMEQALYDRVRLAQALGGAIPSDSGARRAVLRALRDPGAKESWRRLGLMFEHGCRAEEELLREEFEALGRAVPSGHPVRILGEQVVAATSPGAQEQGQPDPLAGDGRSGGLSRAKDEREASGPH